MSFRNLTISVPNEYLSTPFAVLVDDKFIEVNMNVSLPSSNDYCLQDLLSSGQRVVPIDTSIIHDSQATSQLVSNLVNSDANNTTNNFPTDNIL